MPNGEYPKWVKRDEHIGPVLCRNEKEEQDLLEDWEQQKLEAAQVEVEAAKKAAAEAEVSKVVLKPPVKSGK